MVRGEARRPWWRFWGKAASNPWKIDPGLPPSFVSETGPSILVRELESAQWAELSTYFAAYSYRSGVLSLLALSFESEHGPDERLITDVGRLLSLFEYRWAVDTRQNPDPIAESPSRAMTRAVRYAQANLLINLTAIYPFLLDGAVREAGMDWLLQCDPGTLNVCPDTQRVELRDARVRYRTIRSPRHAAHVLSTVNSDASFPPWTGYGCLTDGVLNPLIDTARHSVRGAFSRVGRRHAKRASEFLSGRMNESLSALVHELLMIGFDPLWPDERHSGFLGLGGGESDPAAVSIGRKLHRLGGLNLMMNVCSVVEALRPLAARELNQAWDGIGGDAGVWMA